MNPAPPCPAPAAAPFPARPTLFGALRGVWLFTWKTQLTWPRVALGAIGLLALPLLIFLTTPSVDAWAERNRLQMGNPDVFLNGFSRRAARAGCPLRPEQQIELGRILREEFQQAERAWQQSAATDPGLAQPSAAKSESHDRIQNRSRPVLEPRQFTEFQSYQRRHLAQSGAAGGDTVWNRTRPFYHCLIDLYFFIILPLHCVRLCGALIRDDLEANTLSFLTTRPLTRARLLLVKFLAQATWLELWLLAQTLLLFLAGGLRTVSGLPSLLPLFLATQFVAVLAWSALGLLLGQISKRYMALAFLYGLIVEMGLGRIPTNINTLSLIRHLKTVLAHNPALQEIFHWPAPAFAIPLGALLFAAFLFLGLALALFTFLEYHHTNEMQK